jgi:hypothetical protein
MSAASTLNLGFQGLARSSREACVDHGGDSRLLRIALLYGEQFKLPRASRWVQVLSGTAWVSFDGKDHILDGGECLSVYKAKGGAIVSALCEKGIVFEIT